LTFGRLLHDCNCAEQIYIVKSGVMGCLYGRQLLWWKQRSK